MPSKLDNYFMKKDVKKIIQFMKSDKKNRDVKINLILIKEIGRVIQSKNFKDTVLQNYLSSKLF